MGKQHRMRGVAGCHAFVENGDRLLRVLVKLFGEANVKPMRMTRGSRRKRIVVATNAIGGEVTIVNPTGQQSFGVTVSFDPNVLFKQLSRQLGYVIQIEQTEANPSSPRRNA